MIENISASALDALIGHTMLVKTDDDWYVGKLAWGGKRGFRVVIGDRGAVFRNQWRSLWLLS